MSLGLGEKLQRDNRIEKKYPKIDHEQSDQIAVFVENVIFFVSFQFSPGFTRNEIYL